MRLVLLGALVLVVAGCAASPTAPSVGGGGPVRMLADTADVNSCPHDPVRDFHVGTEDGRADFSWVGYASVHAYVLTVERLVGNAWNPVNAAVVEGVRYEWRLTPGHYRATVASRVCDGLGIAVPWVEFSIESADTLVDDPPVVPYVPDLHEDRPHNPHHPEL